MNEWSLLTVLVLGTLLTGVGLPLLLGAPAGVRGNLRRVQGRGLLLFAACLFLVPVLVLVVRGGHT